MIEFEKGDIETLDFMVATMVQKKSVNGQDLIDEGYIKTESSEGFEFNVRADDRRADEFVRYLSILDKYEVCDCFYGEDSEFGRKNENTLRFHLGGGFKALYSELTSQ
ncbi:hypothetical protein EZV76_13275 [Flagellimonas alvinocaridis]|uniref:Uncharacterized protein n=1 Tax=Flagellimonas alvinocaridis TaxID=2530200 RepID=A0A4S8RK69_9FLAO|nr:hypothetical protein [Allomuricauda alvinocaridis]THV58052.1 hypothetical protein EZV76_13275 [Allomuricauda alvinocaridis]